MKWFRVIGEYGPIGGMCHELFIYTNDSHKAREIFAKRIKRDFPSDWERMGQHNVYCESENI